MTTWEEVEATLKELKKFITKNDRLPRIIENEKTLARNYYYLSYMYKIYDWNKDLFSTGKDLVKPSGSVRITYSQMKKDHAESIRRMKTSLSEIWDFYGSHKSLPTEKYNKKHADELRIHHENYRKLTRYHDILMRRFPDEEEQKN